MADARQIKDDAGQLNECENCGELSSATLKHATKQIADELGISEGDHICPDCWTEGAEAAEETARLTEECAHCGDPLDPDGSDWEWSDDELADALSVDSGTMICDSCAAQARG
jgi:hypothetical protein